jgi:hypothetical protein
LALAKITSIQEANGFIRDKFIPWPNRTQTVKAAEAGSAFVPSLHTDLEAVLCLQEERVVGKDNTVNYQGLRLQIGRVDWKSTLAGCHVKVCDHLDGRLSVRYGPRVLGWYDPANGTPLEQLKQAA